MSFQKAGDCERARRVSIVLRRFFQDESGATAIEYGLLAALIAVVIIGSVKIAGTNLKSKFTVIANNLS
ncbi:MAG: Flp family type IVb pilin [Methylobacteriaceae bacterium]|nr:Flp family type IVb pilin [Methylobacteriaceae bacterium]